MNGRTRRSRSRFLPECAAGHQAARAGTSDSGVLQQGAGRVTIPARWRRHRRVARQSGLAAIAARGSGMAERTAGSAGEMADRGPAPAMPAPATRSVAVGVGIMEYPFDTSDGFWRWVDLCEQGGIDSIWHTDRLVSRTPILECMTALAAIAGRTRRIKFGVNVVSVAMRDPVLLAKQCATIDVLSAGRLLPGFGIGSPRGPEWTAMHLDPSTRGPKTDEALEIIGRLWGGETLDYAGRHFQLTGASIAPLPVQPDLPMWIGGSSEAAVRRTARYGTGWQAGAETPETVGEVIAAIRRAAREAGRPIDDDHYGAAFAFRFG